VFVAATAVGFMLALATTALAAPVPVQPGMATVDKFLPSSACTCHTPLVEQWSPSMHAQAIVDPVFLAKVAQAQAEVGDEVTIFCRRCHSPIGNMTNDFNGTKSEVAGEGVTCMFCHQIVGISGLPGNTSQLLEPDLTRRAQLKEPTAPHPAVYSELHEKAEVCGACHNVDHPTNGAHLESSYTEWAEGPYAAEGIVCQDCHMSREAGFVGPSPGKAAPNGAQRDNIYAMTFVGANVAQGPADQSKKLLQSAATVEMDLGDIVAPSTTASFTVTITNKGAGHYLPTGLTEVREMWLHVYAEAEDGTVTEIGERRFGTVMKDAEGNHPAEMWMAVAVESDDRIPPRESVSETYAFAMPADAERATVVAVLNYRSISDELAQKAGVENPVTEMASARTPVFASEEAKKGEPASEDTATPAPESASEVPWWLIVAGALVAGLVALYAVRTFRTKA
jgi:hypothetical protein